MLPIDPHADRSRRAWLPCPKCNHGTGCPECEGNANCATHWQYLLSNNGTLVYLQCPTCAYFWHTDTRWRRCGERRPDVA